MNDLNNNRSKLIDTIERVGLHDHLCLIYETQEEQFAAAVPFIRFGLERGEQCIYIADNNTATGLLDVLHAGGIDVDSAIKSGALIITSRKETYLKQGYFDPDWMIRFLKGAIDSAKAAGFSALRVTGEMTWALARDPGVERLLEYEAKLNKFFPYNDALAICQYNRNRFSPEVILSIICIHPKVILGGLVCKNYYYIPPDEFLKPNQAELEVKRVLNDIIARESNEMALLKNKNEIELTNKKLKREITERKQAEEKLHESEVRYRGLFESSIDGIAIADLDGKFMDCNQAFADMHGYTKEELYQLTFPELTPSKWHDLQAKIRTEQLLPRGYSDEFEIERIKKDRTIFPASLRVWLIKDKEGKPNRTGGVVRDITDRKKLEKQLKDYSENLEKIIAERTSELKVSEARYRGLFESSIDGIASVNMERIIIDCNQAFADILGYTKEELNKLPTRKIMLSKWYDMIAKIIKEQVLTKGYSDELEIEFIKKDGTIFPISLRSWLIRNKKGRPTGIWGIIRDISERKQAEKKIREYTENLEKMVEEKTLAFKESEGRYRGLYESSIDGLASVDMKGNIIECNQAYADMLGYTKKELYNLNIFELIPHKSQEINEIIHFTQVITKGYSEEFEGGHIKKDGSIIPVSVRLWLIKDKNGNPTGMWGIVRDITERKKLDQMKERFITVATHELRTPLISIKGYVDFIRSGDLGSISAMVDSSLEVVSRNTDRLLYLTDDLLDMQRINSGKLHLDLETLNFMEIPKHCAKEIRTFLKVKKQNFHLDVPDGSLLIQGDRERLSQAIMNLLNNAIKFTPEGGSITLSLVDKDDVIQVQVSDTGIGLQKEDLEKVFQPFADIKKPNYIKGTGLGLSVVKGLVEAHRGKIWAHSEGEGKGTTFTFILPKQKVKEVS
jgi:PAS domain S-box-containing protein